MPEEGANLVRIRTLEEILKLVLANRSLPQPGLDALHAECEEHHQ